MKKLIFFFFLFISPLKAENVFSIDPDITYGKLENGLTYYIRENNSPKEKVSIQLLLKAGSMMEEDHQRGLSHLIEHMAFNGSKNFPKRSIDEYLSSIGLNLGSHYNAFASYLRTGYEFEIPTKNSKDVEKGIQILADISNNLTLEPDAFERERKIVEEEWRQQFDADEKFFQEFKNYFYKDSRFLIRDPIGSIDVIQNFKYQDAIDFYNKWYQPELMAVFVIGDIDPAEIKEYVEKYFSEFENSEELSIPDYKISDFEDQFFIYTDDKVEEATFAIWNKNDFIKVNTIDNFRLTEIGYLTETIFERRIKEIKDNQSAYYLDVYIGNFPISDLDEYRILETDLRQDSILDGIKDTFELIEQINRHGFLENELDLAKKNRINYLKQSLNEEETRSSKDFIQEYERHFLRDEMISSLEEQIEFANKVYPTITVKDLNDFFKRYSNGQNRVFKLKLPKFVKAPSRSDIEDTILKVSSSDIKPYKFELKKVEFIKEELKGSKIIKRKKFPRTDITKLTLKNGSNIFLKQTKFKKDEIRILSFSEGGYSVADFNELASAKYSEEILRTADFGDVTVTEKENLYPSNIVDVFLGIKELSEEVSGYSNNESLEVMFQLLYVNFTNLKLDQYHVDQFVDERINEYKIEKETPRFEFDKKFRQTLYQNHSRKQYPDDKVYEQINLEDIQNFYKDRFGDGANFDFVIVGDFKFNQIEPLIEKYIGSLPTSNRKDKFVDHKIRINQSKEYLEYKEDNAKKADVFRMYNKDFNYSFKEKVKAALLVSMLDKLFFDEIREKDNLVYSIQTGRYFEQKVPKELISFYIFYGSDPKNVETINQRIEEVINLIKNKEFDPKIFKDQKIALKNNYKSRMETNGFWLDAIEKAEKHKQNIEQVVNVNTMIDSITLNEISNLAKKYFDDIYLETLELIAE
ncbi:peptidase M16 inactive domain-containing protein,Insulinase (Peptidase family M16) [alpha proteobacterium HIMB5]|nr:peptidase M16 inactive domain-containing protein,Insulinase (Peptidase family M16) [alpha proteobacterium HIMB5]